MSTRTRTAALALVLGILASACSLDVELALLLDRDGAGEVVLTVHADPAAVAAARQAGADPLAALEEDLRAVEGWAVTRTEGDDGGSTIQLRRGFADPEELAAVTGELAAQLDQPELRPLEPFALQVADDELVLSGGAGLAVTEVAAADLATTVADLEERLTAAVDYRVAVTFPAGVVSTDPPAQLTAAEEGGPTTATWTVAPGEQVVLTATAVRPPPDRRWLLVGLGAGAVLLTMGAAAALWRVRR